MRRIIFTLLICALSLAGCACRHEWTTADCTTAKTCSLCNEVTGEPLGHTWHDADCVTPKTCTVCGKTEGESLGHSWEEATCETSITCTLCAQTEGNPLEHSFEAYTCDGTKFLSNCTRCGQEQNLDPETYARQILTGTWEAKYYFNDPFSAKDPGHTVTFFTDGTGTLELDNRLWYPKTVQLRFTEFGYQDGLSAYSMDFELDGYMLDEWDALEYSTITQDDLGISIRLLIPSGSATFNGILMTMSYTGYFALWDFEKQPVS